MHQKTADEFGIVKGNVPLRFAGLLPSCGKSNLIFRNGKDPAVGNSDFVGVTSKVFNGISKTVKGFLNVGAPVFFVKAVFELLPAVRILQTIAGRRKNKRARLMQRSKMG